MADEVSDEAFVGQVFLERGNGDSPLTYTRICEVFDVDGIGETNSEAEVTTFCSRGFKEYVASLSDGETPTWQLRYKRKNEMIRRLIQDVKDRINREYRLVVEENETPVEYFNFTFVPLGWKFLPSMADANAANFNGRISGEIEIADA